MCRCDRNGDALAAAGPRRGYDGGTCIICSISSGDILDIMSWAAFITAET